MKFIVDAQLPKSLSQLLINLGYDSIHTLDLPDKNKSTDQFIIQISTDQNRVVVTKDRDFLESFFNQWRSSKTSHGSNGKYHQ